MTEELITARLTYTDIVACLLSREREMRDLSQAQLAKRIGISQSQLARLEMGRAPCAVDQMYRICAALENPAIQPGDILMEADIHAEQAAAVGLNVTASFKERTDGALGQNLSEEGLCLDRNSIYTMIIGGPETWKIWGFFINYARTILQDTAKCTEIEQALPTTSIVDFQRLFFEKMEKIVNSIEYSELIKERKENGPFSRESIIEALNELKNEYGSESENLINLIVAELKNLKQTNIFRQISF